MRPQQAMRDAMLATSASLARLLVRMDSLSHCQRDQPSGQICSATDARWTVGDLTPPAPLLAALADAPLANGIQTVLAVQAKLLSALASGDEIHPLWVCRVLLALGNDFSLTYPNEVLRMAAIAHFQLPPSPTDLHNGLALREQVRLGEWLPPPPHTGRR